MIKCKQAQSVLKDGVNKTGEVAVGGPATPQRLQSKLLFARWVYCVEDFGTRLRLRLSRRNEARES